MLKPVITWESIPQFILLEGDGSWNTHRCYKAGYATFVDKCGKVHLLDFFEGWETDHTSTPPILRSFLPQLGTHVPLAIVHDKMLDMGLPRDVAHRGLKAQAKVTKIHPDVKWRTLKVITLAYRKVVMKIGTKLFDITVGDATRDVDGLLMKEIERVEREQAKLDKERFEESERQRKVDEALKKTSPIPRITRNDYIKQNQTNKHG